VVWGVLFFWWGVGGGCVRGGGVPSGMMQSDAPAKKRRFIFQ